MAYSEFNIGNFHLNASIRCFWHYDSVKKRLIFWYRGSICYSSGRALSTKFTTQNNAFIFPSLIKATIIIIISKWCLRYVFTLIRWYTKIGWFIQQVHPQFSLQHAANPFHLHELKHIICLLSWDARCLVHERNWNKEWTWGK